MILDEEGFPKTSKVYPGNVSEPSTLESILDDFLLQHSRQLRLVKPTSEKRYQKENAIKNRLQTHLAGSPKPGRFSRKKGGVKKYERVVERIGRLKEKEHLVARFYEIRVEKKMVMRWAFFGNSKTRKVLSEDFPVLIDCALHERIFPTRSIGSLTTCSPR